MDDIYIALGMATFWMMAFITSLVVALTLWEALGAAISTFHTLKAFDWHRNTKKLTVKDLYKFWKDQFIGKRIWAFYNKDKNKVVYYPWPWMTKEIRNKYQRIHEGKQRGC